VGATVLPANPGLFLNTDTTIFGYYFQWGRNTRFGSGTLTTTNTKFGSIDEANNSDKFYIGENTYLTTQLYDLWSGAKAQGPCPPGWRLPTQADIDALSALTKADVNPWQKVTGDDGFLYFPFAGYRANSNGAMTNWGSSYFCWGGTSVGTMVNRFWGATNSMAKPETEGLSTGFNVRAVRDIPVVTP
jgi:hypothetical protein